MDNIEERIPLPVTVRVAPEEYLSLELRAHELLRDVPLYDVSVVDLPGGGNGRSLADALHLQAAAPRSLVERTLYGVRHALGRAFGWDEGRLLPEDSLVYRLSEKDRRDSEIVPGTPNGAFQVVYRFRNEQLSEIRNATVQGYVCIALSPRSSGYRYYFAVYVIPVSWLTRPYLALIEPFRRFLLYPAMLRRLRNAWQAAYGEVVERPKIPRVPPV
jgi:uncharacterized protein DUF2867